MSRFTLEKFIPDYDKLSSEEKIAFEQSTAGKKALVFLQRARNNFNLIEQNATWWQVLTGTRAEKIAEFHQEFKQKKHHFLEELETLSDYRSLRTHVTEHYLDAHWSDFSSLDDSQQAQLSQTSSAQQLVTDLSWFDKKIKKTEAVIDRLDEWATLSIENEHRLENLESLKQKKAATLQHWTRNTLFEEPELYDFAMTISQKKRVDLQERALRLKTFFPYLNYRFHANEPSAIETLYHYDKPIKDRAEVEENILSDFFFKSFNLLNTSEMAFVNLEAFSKKRAKELAQEILKHFNQGLTFSIDNWFQIYEEKLFKHLMKRLRLINGAEWQEPPLSHGFYEIKDSLAYLWTNFKKSRLNQFVAKFARGHAIIQATGFSTQNENSYLAILDFYNYFVYHEQIEENMSIFKGLLDFFKPLYDEYRYIAYLDNGVGKIARIMMPMVVSGLIIIGASLLLAPLALPELAFTALFIPIVLLSLWGASEYVKVKNNIYTSLRASYYGGAYKIPEFDVTQRMTEKLGAELAKQVRDFYIQELEACDQKEMKYYKLYSQGVLGDKNEKRKANQLRRHELALEWYDISHNFDISYEQIPQIVLNRLRKLSMTRYVALEEKLAKHSDTIQDSVSRVSRHLKETIVNAKAPSSRFASPSMREDAVIKFQSQFFAPPSSIVLQHKLELIDTLTHDVQVCAPCA